MVAEAQDRRFGEGPRERRLADRRAGGAIPRPSRCLGACDQAAGGHTILDPWDAGDRMDLVAQHHTHNRAEAGDRVEPVQGLGVRRLGRRHERPCDLAESRVLAVNQGAIDCHTFVHGGSGKPGGDPVAVRFGGDLLPPLGQGILTGGMLDGGQEFRPCARQRHAAPEPSTGGTHLLGRDRGLGQPPAAQQHGDFLGIARVVFGFAPMDGLHREGLPEPTGHAFASTEVSKPRPGKEACDTDDQIGPVGRNGFEKRFWASRHVPVHQDLAILVQDAEGHGAGMQSDAAVKWVLLRRESPEVSSSFMRDGFPRSAYHGGLLRRGPQ